jgi:hypothetical protein
MLAYVLLSLFCILFMELFVLFRVVSDFQSLIRLSHKAYNIVSSSELSDDEKEAALRPATMEVIKSTIGSTVKLAAICFVLYFSYLLLRLFYPIAVGEAVVRSLSPHTIFGLIVATIIYGWFRSAIIQRLQSR